MHKRLLILAIFLSTTLGALALNPSLSYRETPHKYGIKYETHQVPVGDGFVNLWYFPSTHNSNKLILVSHNGAGNMGDYLHRIKDLISFGFNVVTYDYRGFGESSAFKIDNEVYIYPEFYKDFDAVYNYCLEKFSHELHLYGWGIGAGISISRGYIKPETNVIIADTPFSRLSDMPDKFASISSRMSIPFEDLKEYKDPYDALSQKPVGHFRGILFISGSEDLLFNTQEIEALSELQADFNSDIYVIENPNGSDNYKVDRSHYIRKIYSFMVNS